MVIDRDVVFLQAYLLLTDCICLAGRSSQFKHALLMGSASMPMKPGMALRRDGRRTWVAASLQCDAKEVIAGEYELKYYNF